jgi:hypothetical protein
MLWGVDEMVRQFFYQVEDAVVEQPQLLKNQLESIRKMNIADYEKFKGSTTYVYICSTITIIIYYFTVFLYC